MGEYNFDNYGDYEKEYEIFFEYMAEFNEPIEHIDLQFEICKEGEGPFAKKVPLDDLDEVYNQGDLITELEFKMMMGDL